MSSFARTAPRGAAVALAAVAVAVLFTSSGCPRDEDGRDPAHAHEDGHANAHAHELPAPTLAALRATFQRVDEVRALLAADSLEGTQSLAREIERELNEAARESSARGERGDVARTITTAAGAASSLQHAKDLAEARRAFASLSEPLFALAAADPRLQEGWRAFECPMVEGAFPKWFQRGEQLANPHMGKRMLTCGNGTTWSTGGAKASNPSAANDVAYWTCPMHPSVKQNEPGKCPICGMDLTPVTKGEIESGVVIVDDVRRQKIGVRTARVESAPLAVDVRAVGRVTFDETRLSDVTLKVGGYVEKLLVEKPGQRVSAGQPIMMLQSAELFAAQGELLAMLASKRRHAGFDGIDGNLSGGLIDAAYARFELWGIARDDIAEIEKSGVARPTLPIRAPKGGTVVAKDVVEGQRVDAGTRAFRIAALDHVWVEAEVYESDLARIKVGDPATVSLPYVDSDGGGRGSGSKALESKVTFIYPYLDASTRTGRVRVELTNTDHVLKPDMFADVVIAKRAESVLQVPKSAVIFTGQRRLVFIDLGEGRLKPVAVSLGRATATSYEVLDGLAAGDVVVTSGNFLVAAESRLKSAQRYWSEEADGGTP